MMAMLTVPTLAAALSAGAATNPVTFGDDVAFLKQYTEVVTLSDAQNEAQVAVVPAYQGRVMTSSAAGADGISFGWINRELISSKKTVPHINVFGGEDRFWMGPEGGQFAIFFSKGDAFDLEHWQTPAVIDTDAYELVSKTADSAVFTKTAQVTNWTGTKFDVQIDRAVKLLNAEKASALLKVTVPKSVKMVGIETDNKITNVGGQAWTKETGLLSVWILGMFNPSPETTIVIPFVAGDEAQLGPKVNDAYFGKVPADRLVVKDDVLFFSGDGKYRSKIGLSPLRAKTFAGSYDEGNKVLTLVQYTKPKGATDYVNSMWEMQKEPFAGDVVNSYNDGPPEPGKKPLGPFYELETSSPAAALAPKASLSHVHRTFHFQGAENDLDALAQATLGVSLADIKAAFK
ncbi:MAG TPA: hypothetical protein PLI09_12630 [Candidatus Hydrogenedentes bacterium]|nr:hypothetical protein [Candidatus Hydrogenedentota bacterium]